MNLEDELIDTAVPRDTMVATIGSGVLASSDTFDDDLVEGYGRAAEMTVATDFARGARGAIGVLTGLDDAVDDERR